MRMLPVMLSCEYSWLSGSAAVTILLNLAVGGDSTPAVHVADSLCSATKA